ncbi:MAG TPA: hypothetical protein VGP99_02125, partial [Tepidisphaeraceae bacterium]|nr:hypothetical protein [Tepidisphaeraceae bacterium]
DFAADNAAFLVRRGSWPIIEPRTPLFAELQRLIEKYSKLRPATDQSKPVAIVSAQDAGAGSQIILAKVESAAMGEATLVDHPITRSLEKMDWKKLAPAGIAEPAGDGWKPLVRVGGKTAIAIRETPARQVWIGLQTQPIANTPEFVILWSNIFDWVGEGGEEFVARRTGDLGNAWTSTQEQPAGLKPGWWPGVYRRSDGALLAVNAPDVIVSKSLASDWKPKLAELGRQHRQKTGVKNLTTPLILAAMGLMLLSALTWRGGLKKLREPQQSRHAQDARVTV